MHNSWLALPLMLTVAAAAAAGTCDPVRVVFDGPGCPTPTEICNLPDCHVPEPTVTSTSVCPCKSQITVFQLEPCATGCPGCPTHTAVHKAKCNPTANQ